MTTDSGSIGNLENNLHRVFTSLLVSSDGSAYCPVNDLFSALDEYCDDQSMSEARHPLLILGDRGVGKSALLANWCHRRTKSQTRSRNEFIFFHAIGCTRQSTDIHNLMRRLMTELKKKFEISRDVSTSNDRLSWDLPRFLDLAAKRGKIIVVLDGVGGLELNDGAEGGGTTWLPLEFPPNVRVILSATIPSNMEFLGSEQLSYEETSTRKPRIISELERRHLQVLRIRPVELSVSRSIIETFVKKTFQSSSSSHLSTPYFLTEVVTDEDRANDYVKIGMLLYHSQITDILQHTLVCNPMFLSTFLRCLNWAITRGYSVWNLLDFWLQSENVADLLHKALSTFENGFHKVSENQTSDCERTVRAGGYSALRILYPFHRIFQNSDKEEDADNVEDFKAGFLNKISGPTNTESAANDEQAKAAAGAAQPSGKLSNSVIQSLGDQQWLATSEAAEAKLENIRVRSSCQVSNMISLASKTAYDKVRGSYPVSRNGEPPPSFMEVLVENMLQLRQETEKKSRTSTAIEETMHLTEDVDENESDGDEDLDDEEREEVNSGDVIHDELPRPSIVKPLAGGASIRSNLFLESREEEPKQEETRMHISINDDDSADSEEHVGAIIDPTEKFDLLPDYLKGGVEIEGFGKLLEYALSLLYVARQGLRECELWNMLVAIRESESSSAVKTTAFLNDEARALVSICHRYRGQFEDVWRTMDANHSGVLSRKQMLIGMQKINPEFLMADLVKILNGVGIEEDHPQRGSPTKIPGDSRSHLKINYHDFLDKVGKAAKRIKLAEMNQGSQQLSSTSMVEEFDTYSLEHENSQSAVGTHVTLGPVLEEALLSVLCAIGVLHSPDYQVLVLPIENIILRQVIFDRYLCDRDGELAWHVRIINYFQQQSNSLRRCEELPWHLKICHKWYSLKDTLTDLTSFELMFNSELKGELMRYWLTLTEGPLFTSDDTEKQYMKQIQANPHYMLSEYDIAAAKGLTRKEARRLLMCHQISTFDVVGEFNHSVESWVYLTRPNTNRLCRVLTQIAYFLAEFCLKGQSPPPFFRVEVDKKDLESFDIFYDEILKACLPEGADTTATFSAEDAEKGIVAVNNENTTISSHMDNMEVQLYHFKRWIWTQFPWLALEHASRLAAKTRMMLQDKQKRNKDANADDNDFDMYGYLNQDSDEKGLRGNDDQEVKSHMNEHMRRFWEVKKADPYLPLTTIKGMRKSSLIKSTMTSSSSMNALEHCIKDASETNHIISLGRGTSKYYKSLEDTMETFKDIPHANPTVRSRKNNTRFPSIKMYYAEKHKAMEQDEDIYIKANCTLKLGGKMELPTEGDLELCIFNALQEERLSQMNARVGKAIPLKSEQEVEYYDEVERLGRLRALYDKTVGIAKERQALLNEIKAQIIDREKVDAGVNGRLAEGELVICSLEERHNALLNALEESRTLNASYQKLIEVMSDNPPCTEKRIASLEQDVALAKQQLLDLSEARRKIYIEGDHLFKKKMVHFGEKIDYYSAIRRNIRRQMRVILDQCPDIPTPKCLSANPQGEVIVNAMHQAVLNVSESIDSGAAETAPVSPTQVWSQHKGMNMVLGTLTRNLYFNSTNFNRPTTEENDATKVTLEASLSDSLTEVKAPATISPSATQDRMNDAGLGLPDRKVHTAQQIESEYKSMLDYLQEKTHSSSPEEFIEKYTSNIQLSESLKTHQNVCESKIAQLRTEYTELYDSLGAAVFEKSNDAYGASGATAASGSINSAAMDARYLDQKLFQAEMKLNTSARQAEKTKLLINDVRSGVAHLVLLLNANAKLLSNLPKSVPPQLNSDEDIAHCLSWCEERVLAIQEALVLDANNMNTTTNDNKPMHVRQIELSNLVHDMNVTSQAKGKKKRKNLKEKRNGGISLDIINQQSDEIPTPRAVMVKSYGVRESLFEKKMRQSIEAQDKYAVQYEGKMADKLMVKGNPAKDIEKFLKEALDTHDSKEMLRKANFLGNRKQGRNCGYGWALESIIPSHIASQNSAAATQAEHLDTIAKNEVVERDALKSRLKDKLKHRVKNPNSSSSLGDEESYQGSTGL